MRAELARMMMGHGQGTLARAGAEVMVSRTGTGEAGTASDTKEQHRSITFFGLPCSTSWSEPSSSCVSKLTGRTGRPPVPVANHRHAVGAVRRRNRNRWYRKRYYDLPTLSE